MQKLCIKVIAKMHFNWNGWRILRNEAKWFILRDNLKVHTRQPATQSCHTFANSINLDKDNDEINSGEPWRDHKQEGRKGETKEKKEL